jgi:hypothetical protein
MATVSAGDRRRARAVAVAVVAEASALGVEPPPGLRLWDLAGGLPDLADVMRRRAPEGRQNGSGLAVVLEEATSAEQRRTNGLHVTPPWLADELVGRALDDLSGTLSLCDPACGGGAFLLAGARALHAQGVDRTTIVRDLLWGADVDPVGLATAEAALALWAGEPPPSGRLVVGDALTAGAGLWPDRPAGGFAAVVGNPPFLNQLGRATTRTADEAEQLRARFGPAVQPYTDAAWLFLLLACDLVRPGGRVALVEPLSLVAARDARAIRSALHARAHLRDLWVESAPVFAASVKVCAPVLEVGCLRPGAPSGGEGSGGDDGPGGSGGHDGSVGGHGPVGRGGAISAAGGDGDPDRVWADRLADAIGVPAVDLGVGRRVGDVAEVVAGFRDEYYGLVPLVREAEPGEVDGALVTAGVVDWGRSRWGERTTKFAKRAWRAPVVDRRRFGQLGADEQTPIVRAALRWAERNRRPKVIVATQTRVVEAAVDERGEWVPSVPVLGVLPHDPAHLWLVAAAVSAPAATAWLFRRAPGTALGRSALKVAAGDLSQLPLPVDDTTWAAAARALGDGDFEAYVGAATAMYSSPPDLVAWWRTRLGRPAPE